MQPALDFDVFAEDTPAAWRVRVERETQRALDALATTTAEGIRIPPIAFAADTTALPPETYRHRTAAAWQHWPQPHAGTPEAWNITAQIAATYEPAALILDFAAAQVRTPADLDTAIAGISTPLVIDGRSPEYPWLLAHTGWRGELWVGPETLLAAQPATAHQILQLCADASTHDAAGAGPVLGLALAICAAAEQTATLAAHGWQIAQIAPLLTLRFAVGTNLLIEIARLRAARRLWARVAAAWGGDARAQRLRIQARTRSTSGDTSETEAVRATLGALAAILGGGDALTVLPYDGASGAQPSALAQRLAYATPLLLRHEARLAVLTDPLGGAWALEMLTDQIARAAWIQFQQIIGNGGSQGALAQELVAAAAAHHTAAVASGEITIVGVNRYLVDAEVV